MRAVLQAANARASAEARGESIPAGRSWARPCGPSRAEPLQTRRELRFTLGGIGKSVPACGTEQHQAHDTIRPRGGEISGDECAEGAADEQHAFNAQGIEQSGKRIRVIGRGRRIRSQPIGLAVAGGIPSNDVEARGQSIELMHPGTGLAADAMQETQRRPRTGLAIRDDPAPRAHLLQGVRGEEPLGEGKIDAHWARLTFDNG